MLEHKRPTELLVKQYEKVVARGDLLTEEGWTRACKFLATCDPFPEKGDITIISAPGIIGEGHLDGDHAVVGTKWGDYYGTIDSGLRFKPEPMGSILLCEAFSLVFVHQPPGNGTAGTVGGGSWKIEKTAFQRAAGIPAAIQYLERMRDRSQDPKTRKNAEKSIAALRRLTSTCGTASAC